jgi:hypothetical protein
VEIDTDVGTFQGLATDGTNLYATYGDDEILVYPLPLTHDELPSLTLTLPYEYPNALAVGP